MVSEPQLDLTDRPSLIASLPSGGVAAEIGVAAGLFSIDILVRNAPRLLFLIDPWKQQPVEVCGQDPANVPDEAQEALYHQVWRRFIDVGRVKIIRDYSLQAVRLFPDAYLDWLHFDGNHLQLTEDLVAWWPKVKSGGWLTGHDYTVTSDYIRVKPAVDAFVAERRLELFVTRGDNDIYEKNYPTWVFRKP